MRLVKAVGDDMQPVDGAPRDDGQLLLGRHHLHMQQDNISTRSRSTSSISSSISSTLSSASRRSTKLLAPSYHGHCGCAPPASIAQKAGGGGGGGGGDGGTGSGGPGPLPPLTLACFVVPGRMLFLR